MKQSINQQFTPDKGKKVSKKAAYNVLTHAYLRDFNKHKNVVLGIFPKNENGKVVGAMEVFDIEEKMIC